MWSLTRYSALRPAANLSSGFRNSNMVLLPRQKRCDGRREAFRIVNAAHLPCRVHRQQRNTDIDGPDAEPGRRERPDRRTAGHRVVGDELLSLIHISEPTRQAEISY